MWAKLSELKKTNNSVKTWDRSLNRCFSKEHPRAWGTEKCLSASPGNTNQIQSEKELKLKSLTVLSVWIRNWSSHTQLVGIENIQLLQKTSDRVLRLSSDSATTLLHMYLIESKACTIQRCGFLCNRQKLQKPRAHSMWKNGEPQCTCTARQRRHFRELQWRKKLEKRVDTGCFGSQCRVPKRSVVSWGQAGYVGERVTQGEREACWWCVCLIYEVHKYIMSIKYTLTCSLSSASLFPGNKSENMV